jgi:3-oxoacyl-[acyl-carrier protein] reductase
MADRYQAIANSAIGRTVAGAVGLPSPPFLRRHEPGEPLLPGPAVLGSARGGRLAEAAGEVLRAAGAHVVEGDDPSADSAEPAALVFDASGIDGSERLRALFDFFGPRIRSLGRNGRLLVLAAVPGEAGSAAAATAQRAIEGFTRSAAKEIGRKGSTAQLLRVAEGAEGGTESTLRFLLSARSAFVDGQVVTLEDPAGRETPSPPDPERPLESTTVAVTGAARGIGEAIAEKLAAQGAAVVCIDIPAAGDDLAAVTNRIGATSLPLDITDTAAPERLLAFARERCGGSLDAFVHNAGITRDKTLAKMEPEAWDSVLDVNLSSQERINSALLEQGVLGTAPRIVSVSSVSGIAGNRGQANYATSKAGVIGMVDALAPILRERGGTANAVAPGFIETAMTARMPLATREAGRRTSSLLQGGQPVDVAETIAWLLAPGSSCVNGNVVRVCGQALIGA